MPSDQFIFYIGNKAMSHIVFSRNARKSAKSRRYSWQPAVNIRGGWMLSTLLPFTYS